MTVWHQRDFAAGKRTMIKCEQVKVIEIPHYEGITVEDLIDFAQKWQGD